jgi:hypothetical protein
MAEHRLLANRLLRRPEIGLVEYDVIGVTGVGVGPLVQRIEEGQHEALARGGRFEPGERDDAAFCGFGYRLADHRAGMLGQRQVAVAAAEDRHRVRGPRAVEREAQAEPDVEWIDDDDAVALRQQTLNTPLGGECLAGTGRADEAETVVECGVGNRIKGGHVYICVSHIVA